MAHSWDSGSRPLGVLAAAAFALAALDAHALALGDAEVRSVLGENLDLRIPVTIGKGESIEPSCFKLAKQDFPWRKHSCRPILAVHVFLHFVCVSYQ